MTDIRIDGKPFSVPDKCVGLTLYQILNVDPSLRYILGVRRKPLPGPDFAVMTIHLKQPLTVANWVPCAFFSVRCRGDQAVSSPTDAERLHQEPA